jgi:Ca2+/Na+ antiporter
MRRSYIPWQGIPLEWWPLTRDCFFYTVAVGILLLVLANRRVYWYEALAMILFYLLYILGKAKPAILYPCPAAIFF